jgi:methylphosphotriester-DNA--protein-cysteine methyltransferase
MDKAAYYSALSARDRRFDGVFYVGVTSTGIYCRPVCTARTPKAANCRFFVSREAAEKASFRPCLKCRPELAPGTAPVDDAQRIAHLLAQRIDEGLLDNGDGMEAVAKKFGWSSRQIRRIVQKELGVSPIELVLSRRLLLAKQLLKPHFQSQKWRSRAASQVSADSTTRSGLATVCRRPVFESLRIRRQRRSSTLRRSLFSSGIVHPSRGNVSSAFSVRAG